MDQDPEFMKELEKVKENMLKQYAVNKLISGIKIVDQEVKSFYHENKDNFSNPVTIKASHILLDDGKSRKKFTKRFNQGHYPLKMRPKNIQPVKALILDILRKERWYQPLKMLHLH
jgi:cytochrome c biogenesis protein ResB